MADNTLDFFGDTVQMLKHVSNMVEHLKTWNNR